MPDSDRRNLEIRWWPSFTCGADGGRRSPAVRRLTIRSSCLQSKKRGGHWAVNEGSAERPGSQRGLDVTEPS